MTFKINFATHHSLWTIINWSKMKSTGSWWTATETNRELECRDWSKNCLKATQKKFRSTVIATLGPIPLNVLEFSASAQVRNRTRLSLYVNVVCLSLTIPTYRRNFTERGVFVYSIRNVTCLSLTIPTRRRNQSDDTTTFAYQSWRRCASCRKMHRQTEGSIQRQE